VSNVHLYDTVPNLKKFLKAQGMNPVKVKRNPQWDYMFVTFGDEESKLKAKEKLNTIVHKKKAWVATEATASPDYAKNVWRDSLYFPVPRLSWSSFVVVVALPCSVYYGSCP